jgi:hypothetical protein
MSDAHRIHALNLPVAAPFQLDEDVRVAFETVEREHGLLPNVEYHFRDRTAPA